MMNQTPKALRLHLGIFGRTNVGKSSFLNMVAGQDVAITSTEPGTTTDVVEKVMELLPLGPVVFLDTAGLDDTSVLAPLRIEKTKQVFNRTDITLLVTEPNRWTDFEDEISREAAKRKIPLLVVVNKADQDEPEEDFLKKIQSIGKYVLVSSTEKGKRDIFLNNLKKELIALCPEDFLKPVALLGDLIPKNGLVVMVVPIDLEAPKGRLILPQVQAIRDVLDHDAAVLVVKEREYAAYLEKLKNPPDLVVCDSQAVKQVVADTPKNVKCTTFSMLFARLKGDLGYLVNGARAVDTLKKGDAVLIAESCTHHAVEDDIGRVKIPRWLKEYTGLELTTDVCAGHDFPKDIAKYKLIIHCGSCMLNRREMLHRIHESSRIGVPMTNYGVCISYLQGVLDRTLEPFEENKK